MSPAPSSVPTLARSPSSSSSSTTTIPDEGTMAHISSPDCCSRSSSPADKKTILHLGGPIQYNTEIHRRLSSQFRIIQPPEEELERAAFIRNLKDRKWGGFSAIMRPFWASGNEMRKWDAELIDLLPSEMEVMASAGAGFDWVDVDRLTSRNIRYCNGRGASTEAVADMALCFIIIVFRQMLWSFLAARSGDKTEWQNAHDQVPTASRNPCNRTLGIVGLGDIGFAIAKKVRDALKMTIIYHDVQQKPKAQEKEVDAKFYERLEDLLPECDCLVIAAPHTGKPLLDRANIALLRRGARVVNIARGTLIDEEALADALELGDISAAALDVHANEPSVNPRLRKMKNVFVTSHTGGGTEETKEGFERLAMQNVELVLTGKEPLTPVNHCPIRDPGMRNANGNKHRLPEDEDTVHKRPRMDRSRDGVS